MISIISTNEFTNSSWFEQIYLDNDGDYNVATFNGPSIKDDRPLFLLPGGEPN
jgi:hypothetical protein